MLFENLALFASASLRRNSTRCAPSGTECEPLPLGDGVPGKVTVLSSTYANESSANWLVRCRNFGAQLFSVTSLEIPG